jgi:hypothetical protein
MTDEKTFTGGCLCGAVRYEATGEPSHCGFCYCGDCRKASGSGFIPFINISAENVSFSGETLKFRSPALRGEALRNSCLRCGSLVFGGEVGQTDMHTIYAGTLDDASVFHPTIAIFTRQRAPWAVLPPDLTAFDELPV